MICWLKKEMRKKKNNGYAKKRKQIKLCKMLN